MRNTLTAFCLAFLFISAAIATELQTVTPDQLLDLQQKQNALVVDVRTESEWQSSGIIPNSHKLQSFDKQGHFDREKWLAKLAELKSSPNQPVVLVCRSGRRSGKVGQILTDQLGMENIYHLENGLQGWTQSNHPLSPNCLNIACK